MPKYLLIMRGTDESNAAVMAGIDEMIATTRQFVDETPPRMRWRRPWCRGR
jgi:hypothetical protein